MTRAYGTPIPLTMDGYAFFAAELQEAQKTPGEVLYRVEAVRYSYVVNADYDEYGTTAPRLELFALPVLRFTPHGATLVEMSGCRHRWVDLRPDAKQYASRTAAEATEQFRNRRLAQIYVLKGQLYRAEIELALTRPNDAFITAAPFTPVTIPPVEHVPV